MALPYLVMRSYSNINAITFMLRKAKEVLHGMTLI